MNRPLVLALVLAAGASLPLKAGDIHGKVTCKGVRDCADAVVYVGGDPRKDLPRPDGAREDEPEEPGVLPARPAGPRRDDRRLPQLRRRPSQRLLARRLRRQVQPRHLAAGADQELHVQEGVRGRDAPLQGPSGDGGLRRGRCRRPTSP